MGELHDKEVSLGYNQYFQIGDSYHATGRQLRVKCEDGKGAFATGPLYDWPVVFQFGDHQDMKVEVKDFNKPGLVVDFAANSLRGASPRAEIAVGVKAARFATRRRRWVLFGASNGELSLSSASRQQSVRK